MLAWAYIWPYFLAVLSKPLSPYVWWRLVATCHQQLTSMTLCPEKGQVRLSGDNSASLSPFSHHLWPGCHGVVAYTTQNNIVILGELCNELLSLLHQAPYMLIVVMLTGACRVAIDGHLESSYFTPRYDTLLWHGHKTWLRMTNIS